MRKEIKKIKLAVTYDMGWQKRSSGKIYDSSSSHAFITSGISKGIIVVVLYSKDFWKCDAADKRREESDYHECSNNFEGISKSIEAGEIMKMVEDAIHHCCLIIDVIISDEKITMQDVIKNPSICARG